jgi:site-specific DNA-methyltransferase (adenine-specific)
MTVTPSIETATVYNEDCIEGARKYIADHSIDLIVCDPPFGIGETSFQQRHYHRRDLVIGGYVEAPQDYARFSIDWIAECKRILKDDGSLYVVSGWTNLDHILNAVRSLGMDVRNHIIWKYNFGVFTRKKFVSSHYHILHVIKHKKATPTFNTHSRFGPDDRTEAGGSCLYSDLEDVWFIPREYRRAQIKNCNKLPDALVRKILEYSSNEGDLVCDFFLGNFTTAMVAAKMGRRFVGFELNPEAYAYFLPRLREAEFGSDLVGEAQGPQPLQRLHGRNLRRPRRRATRPRQRGSHRAGPPCSRRPRGEMTPAR